MKPYTSPTKIAIATFSLEGSLCTTVVVTLLIIITVYLLKRKGLGVDNEITR